MEVVQRRRFRNFVALVILTLYLCGVVLVASIRGADPWDAIAVAPFIALFIAVAYASRPRPTDRRVLLPIVTGSLLLLAATLASNVVFIFGGSPLLAAGAALGILAVTVLLVRSQVLEVIGPTRNRRVAPGPASLAVTEPRPSGLVQRSSLTVKVEGAARISRERARRELTSFFAPLVKAAGGHPVLVWVPSSFEEAVSETAFLGQGVKIHFVAQQPHHRAGAVTLPTLSGGSLSFAIIFSPTFLNAMLWGGRKSRWYAYAHEWAHVRDYLEVYQKVGSSNFFSYPASVREFFLHWAQGFSAEYRAEIWAIETVNALIPRGTALSRLAFDAEADRLISALEDLPWRLDGVARALGGRVMTAREFLDSIGARIWEVLTLGAYNAGRSDALSWDAKFLADMRENPEYRFFFDAWGDIVPKLRSLAPPSSGYDVARLREIATLLRTFCEVCGLEFTEVALTFYVGLKAPDFERFAHPTGDQLLRQQVLRLEEVGRSDARTRRARRRAEQQLVALSLDPRQPDWVRKLAQEALDRVRPLIHPRAHESEAGSRERLL